MGRSGSPEAVPELAFFVYRHMHLRLWRLRAPYKVLAMDNLRRQCSIHNSRFPFHNLSFIIQNPGSTNQDRRSRIQNPRFQESERFPGGSLDEKGGFEDQLLYPELKSGGRKSSSQCFVRPGCLKTGSYGFGGFSVSIWHSPNIILPDEVK